MQPLTDTDLEEFKMFLFIVIAGNNLVFLSYGPV